MKEEMTAKLKPNPNTAKDLLWKYIKKVDKAVQILKDNIDSKTPEDTKKLLQNNRIKYAQLIWNRIVGSVYNETDYAYFVEYWVSWRSYNYHKPKGNVFFRGWQYNWLSWNRTFTRASDEIRKDLNKILE